MRKALLFSTSAILILLFIGSCSKNPISQEASESAGDGLVLNALYKKDLIADRNICVGKVGLDIEGMPGNRYLIVRFAVLDEWHITETHVYIGENPPDNNNYKKFPFKHEKADIGPDAQSDCHQIPLTITNVDNYYFAAHAAVTDPDGKKKTAWVKGEFEFKQGWGWYTEITLNQGTVTDIDGNVYRTVKIGDQWWMAENLKVTHYRNGDPIPNITNTIQWRYLATGAYCNYQNDEGYVDTYGRLYNWYAVNDSRNIAPEGWHVPADEEWKQLEKFLGMSESEANGTYWRGTDEGGKLKEIGILHWNSPNTGATNESGFTALPGSYRSYTGLFYYMGHYALFWSSTEYNSTYAWRRYVYYNRPDIYRSNVRKRVGFSVRCVMD